jgi:hypothetical protein
MMPKYIDAEALKAVMVFSQKTGNLTVPEMRDILSLIDSVPAADVATVVRCKDCKYKPTAPDGITAGFWVEFPDRLDNPCPCQSVDAEYSWVPDDDFFCGHGVKEEEDDSH